MTGFCHRGDTVAYRGAIWHVANADFTAPDGTRFERNIVRSPGSVGIVPIVDIDGVAHVVLVSQYRAAHDRFIVEIPAGMRDVVGEDPLETARRELAEEVGLASESIELLSNVIPSPGMSDAVCNVYLATDCTAVPHDWQGPEEENLVIETLALTDALQRVYAGDITDSKTIAGITLAAHRLA